MKITDNEGNDIRSEKLEKELLAIIFEDENDEVYDDIIETIERECDDID